MAKCYRCDDAIAKGEGVRRNVMTGASKASVGSKLAASARAGNILPMFGGTRHHYSVRTICPKCAAELDKAKRDDTRAIVTIAVAVVFVVLLLIALRASP